jgi:hypothetical protein
MNNLTIELKVTERLNKLGSKDYDNIHKWQIVEAFNKGTVDWCRRQLHGTNLKQLGDEQSKRRIDDLQVLLRPHKLNLTKEDGYVASSNWPTDYFEYKRVSLKVNSDCCPDPRLAVAYLVEEANVDLYRKDPNKKPSFEWGETFLTLMNNTVKIYTNDEFEIDEAILTYYKQPRRIEIQGVSDPYTGVVSPTDVTSEFKDDIVELLIDECVKILAGDIESISTNQIADNSVESNN